MTRKIEITSKDYKFIMVKVLLRALINMLKRKYPRTEPCGHRKLLETVRREYQRREPEIVCWLSHCETS